jgi:competence protein CoiA
LSSAILKTSPNGVHFFAHQNGECAAAPETKWHREGKALIAATLASLGYICREEVSGGDEKTLWRADTYFEVGDRRIAIESSVTGWSGPRIPP